VYFAHNPVLRAATSGVVTHTGDKFNLFFKNRREFLEPNRQDFRGINSPFVDKKGQKKALPKPGRLNETKWSGLIVL
jgi:hypothetical protein